MIIEGKPKRIRSRRQRLRWMGGVGEDLSIFEIKEWWLIIKDKEEWKIIRETEARTKFHCLR